MLFRSRNLPVALLTTFYTNPFTIVPLYLLAYEYGTLLLGAGGQARITRPPELDWTQLAASLHTLVHWSLSLGKPLALGLIALACTLAALGYVGVHLAWRAYVVLAWRARRKARGRLR